MKKLFVSYKTYQKLGDKHFQTANQLASLRYENMRLNQQWISAEGEATKWREAYETLLHTPEYKTDVESAFKRGVEHTNSQFRAWLQQLALTYGKEPSNE